MGNVKMRKLNRVITVDETQAKSYLARGYDQLDNKGKVTKEATSGKVINPADHSRLVKELEVLKANNVSKADFDKLQTEYDELEEKAKDFAAKGKALKEENDKLKKQLK